MFLSFNDTNLLTFESPYYIMQLSHVIQISQRNNFCRGYKTYLSMPMNLAIRFNWVLDKIKLNLSNSFLLTNLRSIQGIDNKGNGDDINVAIEKIYVTLSKCIIFKNYITSWITKSKETTEILCVSQIAVKSNIIPFFYHSVNKNNISCIYE